jgi:ParB-like chromosome segregation protein Spo0J
MQYRDRVKELRRVKASQVVGAPWNWRSHPPEQVEALAGSIEELGFFDPLDTYQLPDGRFRLYDGHARRDLLHERIGPDTLVPIIITDLTEAEAKKATALKDPLAAMADADAAKLDALLGEIDVGHPAVRQMLDELAAGHGITSASSGDAGASPPEEFPAYDESIPIEHCCPKCGYRWSGEANRDGHAG